jgi:hypothetical protein
MLLAIEQADILGKPRTGRWRRKHLKQTLPDAAFPWKLRRLFSGFVNGSLYISITSWPLSSPGVRARLRLANTIVVPVCDRRDWALDRAPLCRNSSDIATFGCDGMRDCSIFGVWYRWLVGCRSSNGNTALGIAVRLGSCSMSRTLVRSLYSDAETYGCFVWYDKVC